jgi:hypothetical protein
VNGQLPSGKFRKRCLFVAVSDPTFGQVVGRKFHSYPVAREHADAIAAQSAGEVCEYSPFLVKLNAELSARKFLNNGSGYFDTVFFAHSPPLRLFGEFRNYYNPSAPLARSA